MTNPKSVFLDLEDDPVVAANLTIRSDMMLALRHYITERGWTQAQAANFFGTSQARVSYLLTGKISEFRIDDLVNWAHKAGLKVELKLTDAAIM